MRHRQYKGDKKQEIKKKPIFLQMTR